MRGVVFDRFEADRLSQRAEAETMWLHRETQQARGEGIKATLFSDIPGEPARAILKAPQGEVSLKARVTRLHGGVRLVDDQGRTLETEALTYDAAEDHVHGEDPVTVTGANFKVQGVGVDLRTRQDDLQLGGPVRAVFDGPLSPAPSGP